MISTFTAANTQFADLQLSIRAKVNQAILEDITSADLLLSVQELVADTFALDSFSKFITAQSENDDTWRLLSNFVFYDCFCYVSLFLAIRTSNWDLRVASLKSMATLFSAYDRPCYQKLVPSHIADIQSYPDDVKK